MDDFMEALISREAMPDDAGGCRHCKKALAVWRCKDCVLATPLCRACMRQYHRENPFHRIENWNGSYFRPATLSEVGTYFIVQHHTGQPICKKIRHRCNLLDSAEEKKDDIEQEHLRRFNPVPAAILVPVPDMDQYFNDMDLDIDLDMDTDMDMKGLDDDDLYDDLYDGGDEEIGDTGTFTGPGEIPEPDPAFQPGTQVRVVHSNGLHSIQMVNCRCRGEDVVPLDLFAAQLLPASFKRIKTIFTAQVLDMFRLSNLELKASAYQFYQLLRRQTLPMAPGDVDDLYREFRRMSRIWRWMKKLKWAGYAGGNKSVREVKPGELAIFCPACPQPGINIPENWKEDCAR